MIPNIAVDVRHVWAAQGGGLPPLRHWFGGYLYVGPSPFRAGSLLVEERRTGVRTNVDPFDVRAASSTRRIGTELDGVAWELAIEPSCPTVIVYRATRPGAASFDCVAVGHWDGERIHVADHEWRHVLAAPSRLKAYLPMLSSILHTELQP